MLAYTTPHYFPKLQLTLIETILVKDPFKTWVLPRRAYPTQCNFKSKSLTSMFCVTPRPRSRRSHVLQLLQDHSVSTLAVCLCQCLCSVSVCLCVCVHTGSVWAPVILVIAAIRAISAGNDSVGHRNIMLQWDWSHNAVFYSLQISERAHYSTQ